MAVHPRMGGEQWQQIEKVRNVSGSSPHGRGTVRKRGARRPLIRFIPAWAGNSLMTCDSASFRSVHPRMGGEQAYVRLHILLRLGSSPHGRGTVKSSIEDTKAFRFIPAWAGNRARWPKSQMRQTVHPRMGGEQRERPELIWAISGSSPHGRGTGSKKAKESRLLRFIPAWAGNSCHKSTGQPAFSVHPRMGGEQATMPAPTAPAIGSSPHGRGTEVRFLPERVSGRFIPAWAGNRILQLAAGQVQEVHPRMGGEQRSLHCCRRVLAGSSPHGRGTGGRPLRPQRGCRFIPAWAGNSWPGSPPAYCRSVHPRMGGEQHGKFLCCHEPDGSSPHGRGTVLFFCSQLINVRFIPAWAGNSTME